jgi:hypothetical protein
MQTWKSTSRYVFTFGTETMLCKSQKQQSMALSSIEAKYIVVDTITK